MRFIVVGAGAVGAVTGSLLGAAGHAVDYWARPGQAMQPPAFRLERDGRCVRVAASWLSAGAAVPECDWVLVAVRSEQLDAALSLVARELGAQRRVAIAAVTLDGLVERARSQGLQGEVFAYHVSFGAYRDPSDAALFHWFPFLTPSMITSEGHGALVPKARELAATLRRAGLPASAARSLRSLMALLVALSTAFTAGYELAGWELERLARDARLRTLTARAMAECARALGWRGARRWLLVIPAPGYALLLRVLPWLVGVRGCEAWRHHGPKIRDQTDYFYRHVSASSAALELPLPALHRLFDLRRALPAPAPASTQPRET